MKTINALPDEILIEIFEFASHANETPSKDEEIPIRDICQICATWRNLAIRIGRFWTKILIRLHWSLSRITEYWKTMSGRVGLLPITLSFSLTVGSQVTAAFVDDLRAMFKDAIFEGVHFLLAGEPHLYPAHQYLDAFDKLPRIRVEPLSEDDDCQPSFDIGEFLLRCRPSTWKLSVSVAVFHTRGDIGRLPLQISLKKLSLNSFEESFVPLRSILRQCVNLRSLSIEGKIQVDETDNATLTSDHLQRLNAIRFDEIDVLASLSDGGLSRVFPNLEHAFIGYTTTSQMGGLDLTTCKEYSETTKVTKRHQ